MRRLHVRLLMSHLAVAAVGAVVTGMVVALSAPALFDEGVSGLGPGFRGGPGGRLREVFGDALRSGLLLGGGAALVVAVVAGWYLAQRVLRPLDDVREATRRIAAGDYHHVVTRPADHELAALADDVNALARTLEETEARRVRLLGEVAHEMRTPLTVLTGRVEGLVDGVFEVDESLLAELGGELGRLRRLADDLSELSRVEEGRLELRVEPVDLRSLVADVCARWSRVLADTQVVLEVADSPSVTVAGDRDRLAQVLDNLIGNAVRAVAGDGHIRLEVHRHGPVAEVAVRDDGAGLAAEELEAIFERFHRGSAAGRVPGGVGAPGSGIGLTVSRGIARAHGGTLVARSDGPGAGATFVLSLPTH